MLRLFKECMHFMGTPCIYEHGTTLARHIDANLQTLFSAHPSDVIKSYFYWDQQSEKDAVYSTQPQMSTVFSPATVLKQ